MKVSKEDVLKANIELHTQLADVYKESEPHYRPENRARVEEIIRSLSTDKGEGVLLDVGCGIGFIIDIAKKYFSRIVGIDITEAMLEKVDTSSDSCDIEVKVAEIENMPFDGNSYDVVTAYAVIHHLHELKPAFQEIHRVLKPGGSFYTDTDPNYYFWEAFTELPQNGQYSASVKREVDAVQSKDKELQEKFGISPDILNTAEVLKHDAGGFKAEDLESLLYEVGFSEVKIHYEWFVGEARVIHSDDTRESVEQIRLIMHELLPLTRHLFKYLRIMAVK